MSRGTSGAYSVLFPGADTGLDNHIRSAHTYLLPADGDGWFGVTGPAGNDVVYFVVTPSRLTDGWPARARFAPGAAAADRDDAPLQ